MTLLFVAKTDNKEEVLETMNKIARVWTDRAARGECRWICSDCGCSFQDGMPDEYQHGYQKCTDIIKRDKLEAFKKMEIV